MIYYNTSLGKVEFIFAKSKFNICPKKHAGVLFQVLFEPVDQPIHLKITGSVRWFLFGDDIIILNGKATNGQQITTKTLEIGLKQAFGIFSH